MDEFNRKITKFLSQHYPDFNSSDVANFSHDVFKDDIAKDKEKIMALMKLDVSNYMDDLKPVDNDFIDHRKNDKAKQKKPGTGTGSRKMIGTADRIGSKAVLSTDQIKGVSNRLLQALEKMSQENRKAGLARLETKKHFLNRINAAVPAIMGIVVVLIVAGIGTFFLEDIKSLVVRFSKGEEIMKKSSTVARPGSNFLSKLMV